MRPKTRSVDWNQVREMLRRSEASLRKALHPDAQEIETAYRKRAAGLAQRQEQLPGQAAAIPFLVFLLGSERYALELSCLREIREEPVCTPVPGAPPEYRGLVNLRGEIRPVVDLARILGLPPLQGASDGYILVVREEIWSGALKVDQIADVIAVSRQELAAPFEEMPELPARYLKGVIRDSLLVLDAAELLRHRAFKEESQS